ncbi:MAG: RHS repeat-associated core domain-containing protein [Flavobacteriales bacterium]|nr:RHS repeat-associated core domain-containing protein [Flavobacteriales bacterium]
MNVIRENIYIEGYPYGKILREFQNGLGAEKYLTTHHERDKETGLDYRGARYYDADVARFLSLDPHASNYVNWSPYAYVADNPIRNIDPTGKDVIVLSAPEGASGFGHAAVLVGNDKDGWKLYSKNGTTENGGFSGPSNVHSESGVYYESLQSFANSSANFYEETGEVKYTGAFRITSDKETDAKMRKTAAAVVKSDYNLLKSSCIDVCTKTLISGGFDGGGGNNVPNTRVKKIIKNNDGTDVSGKIVPSEEAVSFNKAEAKRKNEIEESGELNMNNVNKTTEKSVVKGTTGFNY